MEEQEEAEEEHDEEHEEHSCGCRWRGKEGDGNDGCGRKALDVVIMVVSVSANDATISARADLLLPLLGRRYDMLEVPLLWAKD